MFTKPGKYVTAFLTLAAYRHLMPDSPGNEWHADEILIAVLIVPHLLVGSALRFWSHVLFPSFQKWKAKRALESGAAKALTEKATANSAEKTTPKPAPKRRLMHLLRRQRRTRPHPAQRWRRRMWTPMVKLKPGIFARASCEIGGSGRRKFGRAL